jgi:hypothetical protein
VCGFRNKISKEKKIKERERKRYINIKKEATVSIEKKNLEAAWITR